MSLMKVRWLLYIGGEWNIHFLLWQDFNFSIWVADKSSRSSAYSILNEPLSSSNPVTEIIVTFYYFFGIVLFFSWSISVENMTSSMFCGEKDLSYLFKVSPLPFWGRSSGSCETSYVPKCGSARLVPLNLKANDEAVILITCIECLKNVLMIPDIGKLLGSTIDSHK